MLKTKSAALGIIAGLFLCANIPAQDKPSQNSSEVTQQKKAVTNDNTTKTNVDTVIGKVESFDPGKSIKVSVPGTIITSKSFDLSGKDITSNVPSGIKVGDWVRVRETDENSGHKMIAVSRSSESAASKANAVK